MTYWSLLNFRSNFIWHIWTYCTHNISPFYSNSHHNSHPCELWCQGQCCTCWIIGCFLHWCWWACVWSTTLHLVELDHVEMCTILVVILKCYKFIPFLSLFFCVRGIFFGLLSIPVDIWILQMFALYEHVLYVGTIFQMSNGVLDSLSYWLYY